MVHVLFVCLGNICRSPMAEAVFRHKVKEAGLDDKIQVDSAGTGDWHTGKEPHHGTCEILTKNKIDYQGLTARQIMKEDIQTFDYIFAMDSENLQQMKIVYQEGSVKELRRLLEFLPDMDVKDVPDPYFTGNFDEVYTLIEDSCSRLLLHIREQS